MSLVSLLLILGGATVTLILLGRLIYYILLKLFPAKRLKLSHLPGQKAKTVSAIGPTPFDTGAIKFKGDTFPAITKDHSYIPKGTIVSIIALEGLRIVVKSENKG